MGNVALMQNMTNDMNMHGGWEGFNLLELNLVTVPYSHRSGSCTAHCGGEGGSVEDGTWAPIYWSTGNKASKWSGATGACVYVPQQGTVFDHSQVLGRSSIGEWCSYITYLAHRNADQ